MEHPPYIPMISDAFTEVRLATNFPYTVHLLAHAQRFNKLDTSLPRLSPFLMKLWPRPEIQSITFFSLAGVAGDPRPQTSDEHELCR